MRRQATVAAARDRQGLNNDNVNKLLEDSKRNIWVSTDDGLALIDDGRSPSARSAAPRVCRSRLLGGLRCCDVQG